MYKIILHKEKQPRAAAVSMLSQRSHPGQKDEGAMWLYAPAPEVEDKLLWYALNVWVYTAVSRIASAAAAASLSIIRRNDETKRFDNHALVDLLGAYGRPNDNEDASEFLETHFHNLELAGNSFWLWVSTGGRVTEVYNLEPERVQIEPGVMQSVQYYVYRTTGGRHVRLDPVQVTHFRKYHPKSRYYGLSAFEALRMLLYSDASMERWNQDTFKQVNPHGIVIVPTGTNEKERIEDEFNARSGRRTIFLEGDAGSVSYLTAGLNPKDMDFVQGRLLTRQAVYEALELPLGMLSESSTEAHARVAERQFYAAVDKRLRRTAKKVTADALRLWHESRKYAVKFEDRRRDVDDWQQMKLKVDAMHPYHSINEIRANVFNLEPVDWGEKQDDQRQNESDDSRIERASERLGTSNEESQGTDGAGNQATGGDGQ